MANAANRLKVLMFDLCRGFVAVTPAVSISFPAQGRDAGGRTVTP